MNDIWEDDDLDFVKIVYKGKVVKNDKEDDKNDEA